MPNTIKAKAQKGKSAEIKSLYFKGIVTVGILSLLIWNHDYGGVPSHHILHREDLPKISNWWGGLLLPLLTWFLLYRIQRRIIRHDNGNSEMSKYLKHTIYRFAGFLLFGILLSVFFTLGFSEIPEYMIFGLFLISLFVPIYREECILGFVLGMTFTFGAVLPTGVGTILALIGVVLYQYVRTGIIFIIKKIKPLVSPNKDNIIK